MKNLGHCLYCLKARAVQIDHLITKNQARRRHEAMAAREQDRFKVPACRECNEGKGARFRVPVTHESLIPELQRITGNTYAVWDGKAEGLREVVK